MRHKILEDKLFCLMECMINIEITGFTDGFFSGKLSEKGILSCFCGSGGE